jgi:nucleoside 2-deoxyribosyltransferase
VRIYVAASSDQLERAKAAIEALQANGHVVTHDWTIAVEEHGTANPRDATVEQRAAWATDDLTGVHDADILWLLMPGQGGFGAAVELGYALAHGRPIVVSGGDPMRSIFTAFATVYDRDDQALAEAFRRCDCETCVRDRVNGSTANSQGRN